MKFSIVFLAVFYGWSIVDAFSSSPYLPSTRMTTRRDRLPLTTMSTEKSIKMPLDASTSADAPPLRRHRPRKICLLVEPTPFTHVSGYANRFKEMLRYLAKAGDKVSIVTTDSFHSNKELPKEYMGYEIHHTQGFTFPLYNQITLTFDLPEMKGLEVIESLKPDVIHVTSP